MDDYGNDLCFYFLYLPENNHRPWGFNWTGFVYYTLPEALLTSPRFRWS